MRSTSRCLYCERDHTPRSAWCLPCRESLRRWLRMTARERENSTSRAVLRMNRVTGFSSSRVVAHRRRRAA